MAVLLRSLESPEVMLEQLVESWQINHRVTLMLLDALSDDALAATLSKRGGRGLWDWNKL